MEGRPHHQHGKRVGGEGIAAEPFAAGDLGDTVETDRRGTHGIARGWHPEIEGAIGLIKLALPLAL